MCNTFIVEVSRLDLLRTSVPFMNMKYCYSLDVSTKPTYSHKYIKTSYIINIVCLLHVSATLVAILMACHYKEYITEFMNQCTEIWF